MKQLVLDLALPEPEPFTDFAPGENAELLFQLGEWAAFFAAGAGKRAAAEAGLRGVVSEREADDLVREAESFLAVVARVLGVAHQQALPVEPSRRQGSAGPAIARAS